VTAFFRVKTWKKENDMKAYAVDYEFNNIVNNLNNIFVSTGSSGSSTGNTGITGINLTDTITGKIYQLFIANGTISLQEIT